MPARERGEDGRYSGAASDDDFLAAVEEHEPASTTEVAEAVGYKPDGARRRLKALEEDGRVTSKDVGRTKIWMLVDREGSD